MRVNLDPDPSASCTQGLLTEQEYDQGLTLVENHKDPVCLQICRRWCCFSLCVHTPVLTEDRMPKNGML